VARITRAAWQHGAAASSPIRLATTDPY